MAYTLAKTSVRSNVIFSAISGNFLRADELAIILGQSSSIEVFRETETGFLTSLLTVPVFDTILKISKIPGRVCNDTEDWSLGLDRPLLLLESHRLVALHYDGSLHRFRLSCSIDLHAAGLPFFCHEPILEVNDRGTAVALGNMDRTIAVVRIGENPTTSFLPPLTGQYYFEEDSMVKSIYLDDLCFVELPDEHSEVACGQSAVFVLITYERHGSSDTQLQFFRIDPDRLVREYVPYGLQSLQRQVLPAPWPGGVLMLSSEGLIHVNIYQSHGCYYLSGISTVVMYGKIDPSCYTEIRELPKVNLEGTLSMPDVGASWRSKNSNGGILLVRIATDMLHFEFQRGEHPGSMPSFHGSARALSTAGQSGWPLSLPSGAFLVRTADQHVEVLVPAPDGGSVEQQSTFEVNQRTGHIAPVWDAAISASLGLSQPQIFAVSGEGHPGSPGALHVLHGGQVLDTLYECPADNQGITGLWSIPIRPADVTSVLVIISFVSGSRAMTAGTILSDVTETIRLSADTQTLAAGSIADFQAAQVTSKAVYLCALHSLMSQRPSYSEGTSSAAEVRPRKKASHSEEDMSFSSSDESVTARMGHIDGAASSMEAGREPSAAFSSLHLEAELEGRDACLVWEPPGGASISCACVRKDVVLLTCPHLKSLTALLLVQNDAGKSGGRSTFLSKRKRQQISHHMVEAAQLSIQAELSCIHALDAPEGLGLSGGLLCVVGTYEPAVELLYLSRHHSKEEGSFLRFKRLCLLHKEALCPVLHSSGMVANLKDLPESVLLLPVATRNSPMQMLCGWRSGLITQIGISPPSMQPTSSAVEEAAGRISACLSLLPQGQTPGPTATGLDVAAWHISILCVRRFTALPTKLVSLPPGMQAHALAVGERVSLLRFSPCSGRLELDLLALAGVSHAVPLLDPLDTVSSGRPLRCSFLVAGEEGSLRLLELQQEGTPNTVTFPLDGRPKCLAVVEQGSLLAVIVDRCYWKLGSLEDPESRTFSNVDLINPTTGAVEKSLELPWKRRAICMAALGPSFESSLQAGRHSCIAVGVKVLTNAREGPGHHNSGQLMVLEVHPMGISPLARMSLPDPVQAVCHLRDALIVAAVGKRLACFDFCFGAHDAPHLVTESWAPTQEEVTSLSVTPQGVIVAGGATQSVTLYTHTDHVGLRVLCADSCSRHAVSCLASTPRSETADVEHAQRAVCLDVEGGIYGLQYEQPERNHERNMRLDMHFNCHGGGVRLLPGTLRCAEEGAVGVEALRNATGPWLACTREGAIVELRPVSAGDYAVLAGLEAVMARSELTRPLSGASHSAYGFAVEAGAGGKGALAAAMAGGSKRAVNGDFLAQLLQLPDREVQDILDSAGEQDLPTLHADGLLEEDPAVSLEKLRSLLYVLDSLDRLFCNT